MVNWCTLDFGNRVGRVGLLHYAKKLAVNHDQLKHWSQMLDNLHTRSLSFNFATQLDVLSGQKEACQFSDNIFCEPLLVNNSVHQLQIFVHQLLILCTKLCTNFIAVHGTCDMATAYFPYWQACRYKAQYFLSKDQRFTNIIKYPYLLGRQGPANKCLKSFEDNFSTQYNNAILKKI